MIFIGIKKPYKRGWAPLVGLFHRATSPADYDRLGLPAQYTLQPTLKAPGLSYLAKVTQSGPLRGFSVISCAAQNKRGQYAGLKGLVCFRALTLLLK